MVDTPSSRSTLQKFHSFATRALDSLTTPPPSPDPAGARFREHAARSAAIRSNNTDAGSSDGSCGTSRPSNAAFNTDRRNPADRARAASTARSAASMNENCRSTSATIRACSSSGGPGTRCS